MVHKNNFIYLFRSIGKSTFIRTLFMMDTEAADLCDAPIEPTRRDRDRYQSTGIKYRYKSTGTKMKVLQSTGTAAIFIYVAHNAKNGSASWGRTRATRC